MTPLVLESVSNQQHLAPLRKKFRVAVCIVDENGQAQCSATAYGGYGAAASAPRENHKPARSLQQADAAPAESPTIQRSSAKTQQHTGTPTSIALSSSAARSHRVYCYAVASCAPQVQRNFGLLHTATSQENLSDALAPSATSARVATAHVQQFKDRVTEYTRSRTLVPRVQIPVTARIAWPSALNCKRPVCDKLFTSRAPPTRGELLPTSALALTPTVLPDWQHLHPAVIAQGCKADTRMRSDVRSCTPLNLVPLYIKCSPQHSPSFSRCHANSKVFFATRRLFPQAMSSDAEDRLFNGVSIGAVRVDNATLSRLRECAVCRVCCRH